MAFMKCDNISCSRAGWCKRVSYTPDNFIYRTFDCCDRNNWEFYIRNKAREIYERENPENAYRVEIFELQQHENNNREPGVREDVNPDITIESGNPEGDAVTTNRILQFFECRNRRSEGEGPGFFIFTDDTGERPHVLQDVTRDGIPFIRPFSEQPDDRPNLTGLFCPHPNTDIETIFFEALGELSPDASEGRQDTTDN